MWPRLISTSRRPGSGTVFYSDELQILVKWDDGRSESERSDVADHFRIVEA